LCLIYRSALDSLSIWLVREILRQIPLHSCLFLSSGVQNENPVTRAFHVYRIASLIAFAAACLEIIRSFRQCSLVEAVVNREKLELGDAPSSDLASVRLTRVL
jgi:hypothetical protein